MNIRIQCICNCRSNTFLYASLVSLAWLLNSSKPPVNYYIRGENFIYQVVEYPNHRNLKKTTINVSMFLCELSRIKIKLVSITKVFISSRAWGLCLVEVVFKLNVSEDTKKGYMRQSIWIYDIHPCHLRAFDCRVFLGGGGGGNLNLVWLGWGILIGRERFFQWNTRVLSFIMKVVKDKGSRYSRANSSEEKIYKV